MSTAKELAVLVDGKERRFHLQKFTIAQALDHIERAEKAWNTARDACVGALGDPMDMTLTSRAFLDAIRPVVVGLLAKPADEGGPLTDEDFWNLDAGEVARVLDAQEEFGNVRDIVVRGQLLKNEAIEQEAKRLQVAVDALQNKGEV